LKEVGAETAEQTVAKKEPVQRNPLDLEEWQIESVSNLNHNCIVMVFKTTAMDITSCDPNPGGVWHVDLAKEDDNGQELKRAYTPISDFDAYHQGRIDMMIKIYPDGLMTQYLSTLAVGSKMLMSPPIVTEKLEGYHDLVMIAGGSAVTVAIQICQEQLRCQPQGVWVDLYMCNHAFEDVLYQEYFDKMLAQYAQFRLVHCLSKGGPPEQPAGHSKTMYRGRLTTDVFHENPRPRAKCIVSGPRGLCRAAVDIWKGFGMAEDSVHCLDELPEAPVVEEPAKQASDTEKAVAESSPMTAELAKEDDFKPPAGVAIEAPEKPDTSSGGVGALICSL
jgi:ferredoxin-NADP reductase